MPPTVKKSGLAAKYGGVLDNAVKSHGGDETTFGIQQIPPGITNGVAQLTECKFDVYKSGLNTGEYYFRCAGMVVEPKEVVVNGQTIPVGDGSFYTSTMEACCDTKNQAGKVTTQEEHIARVLNSMRQLGADTTGVTANDLEALAAAIKQAQPYFRFSTSVRKAQDANGTDGVWENWYGTKGLEDYVPPDGAEGAVVDDTPVSSVKSDTKPSDNGKVEYRDDVDSLDKLLAKAVDEDDGDAQTELIQLAVKATGKTEEEVSSEYPEWADVVAAIRNPGTADAAQEPEPEKEWEPEKEESYSYKPMVKGPGGKLRKAGKGVMVEVTSASKAKRTVGLKNIADPKTTYKDVSWDDLESAE